MPPYTTITTVVPKTVEALCNAEEVISKKLILKSEVDRSKYKSFFGEFETPLIWPNIIGILGLHVLAVYALITFPWLEDLHCTLRFLIYGHIIGGIGGFGITGGAHRYWTHKTFKAKLPLRIILVICYSMAGQNSILDWVRDHRVHHKFTETDADPHNSNRGFFFAHVGWLMMRKHPDIITKGSQINCSDIFEDPLVVFLQRYWTPLKLIFCFIIPTLIPWLLWNESLYWTFMSISVVRYCLSLNFTWLVNSAAHIWGNRPYDKNLQPVENIAVSVVAIGEGWHNYHHTFPWDYKAAELGNYRTNVTTLWLDFFAKIGWAYDLKYPSQELVQKVVEKSGDGSHPIWGHEVPEPDSKQKEKEF